MAFSSFDRESWQGGTLQQLEVDCCLVPRKVFETYRYDRSDRSKRSIVCTRYCRSWFAIDLTVIMVDALLMLLQELHGSEPEGQERVLHVPSWQPS